MSIEKQIFLAWSQVIVWYCPGYWPFLISQIFYLLGPIPIVRFHGPPISQSFSSPRHSLAYCVAVKGNMPRDMHMAEVASGCRLGVEEGSQRRSKVEGNDLTSEFNRVQPS